MPPTGGAGGILGHTTLSYPRWLCIVGCLGWCVSLCCAPCSHTSASTALLEAATLGLVMLWAAWQGCPSPLHRPSVVYVCSLWRLKPLSQAPFGRGSVARGFPSLGACRRGSPNPQVGLLLGSNCGKDCLCGVAVGVCVCACASVPVLCACGCACVGVWWLL